MNIFPSLKILFNAKKGTEKLDWTRAITKQMKCSSWEYIGPRWMDLKREMITRTKSTT